MIQAMTSFKKMAKDGRVKQPVKLANMLNHDEIDPLAGKEIRDETRLGRVIGCMEKVPL